MRILIVDDNADMLELMRIPLEEAGYQVETTQSGHLALDSQRRCPADLLIADIFMPETDGLELISKLRSEFPRMKIVAMSAMDGRACGRSLDYLAIATMAGAHATMRKPFDVGHLMRTVHTVLA
jgi:CheY-like chemotaxis protein